MGLIYMATSPSGKSYIGQTAKTLEQRLKNHIKEAKSGSPYLFHAAIRKYGIDNFTIIILKDNISDTDLDKWERFYIQKYNTYNNGYNLTTGGEGNRKITDNQILELWDKGLTLSEIAIKLKVQNHTIYHRAAAIIPTEDIQKRRYQRISEKKSLPSEEVEKIKQLWEQGYSLTAMENLCGHERHCIARTLRKIGITDEQIKKQANIASSKDKRKPVLQYDKDMNFIAEYESLSEAARQLKLQLSCICQVIKGKRKTTGGYIFKYKENYDSN